jgi:hypothetical protein
MRGKVDRTASELHADVASAPPTDLGRADDTIAEENELKIVRDLKAGQEAQPGPGGREVPHDAVAHDAKIREGDLCTFQDVAPIAGPAVGPLSAHVCAL